MVCTRRTHGFTMLMHVYDAKNASLPEELRTPVMCRRAVRPEVAGRP